MGRIGQFLRTFHAHENPKDVSLAVAPNGEFLVTSGGDGMYLRVWDSQKFQLTTTLKGHGSGSFR